MPDAKLARPDLDLEMPDIDFAETTDSPEPADEPVAQASATVDQEPAPVEDAPSASPPSATRSDPPSRTPEPRGEDHGSAPSLDALVSSATTASVGQAFNILSHTIMSQNAHTLEDLVREMLRPMLKAWLDDNLPPLVERLVRTEIERVARGSR